jgi:hypothetical protein
LLRFQQTPKRVEIVAEDARSLRRQFVHQMRVAVIRDMKEIRVVSATLQVSRVDDEPIPGPVRVQRHSASSEPWQALSAATKLGAPWLDRETMRIHRRQMSSKHVRAQVHARPTFLGEIAKEGQP